MKSVLKLIQNELIKIYRQISWKILTILALLIAIGLPLLNYAMNNLGGGEVDYREIADSFSDPLNKEYYLVLADVEDYFNEKNVGEGSWQYAYYRYDYATACRNLKAMELVINDFKNITAIMDMFYVDGIERVWEGNEETDKYTYQERIYNNYTGEVTYGELQDFTPELARRLRDKFSNEKTKLERQITTKFSVYIDEQFKEYNKEYQTAQNELKTVESIYQSNSSVLNRYQTAKLKADGLGTVISVWKNFQNNIGALDSLTQKQQGEVLDIFSAMTNAVMNYSADYAAVSREEFESNGGRIWYRGCDFSNYNEYLTAVERQQNLYYQALKQYSYAMIHNIPIARLDRSGARWNLKELLSVDVMVVMFLAIFLSAVIVANEHSSGAIRLLVIRPCARWKILLSKLSCVIIYTVCLTAATSLLSTIAVIMIYGWNDLSVPFLLMNGDNVAEIPPILYYIYYNAIEILPSIFAACIAFLLSVLSKRGVLSLAIAMLINVFGTLVSQISYEVIMKAKWLKITPIPYFNVVDAFPEPMQLLNSWSSPINYGLTLGGGIIVLLVYSLIILTLTFVIFRRQQIKN